VPGIPERRPHQGVASRLVGRVQQWRADAANQTVASFSSARAAWNVTVLLLCATGALAGYAGSQAHAQLHQLHQSQTHANSGPPQAATAFVAVSAEHDFSVRLPMPPQALKVVEQLHAAARSSGIVVASLSATSQPATLAQLGRQEYEVVLRGPYAGIKQMLGDTLGRFDGSTVRSLRLRQDASAGMAEAQVVVVVWSAPERAQPPSAGRGG
jgi:hypothetical protein